MKARGRDFFIMSLAYALGMTRRQLLNSMDSMELTMWEAYFREVNRKPENKTDKAQLENQLKTFFAVKKEKIKHA